MLTNGLRKQRAFMLKVTCFWSKSNVLSGQNQGTFAMKLGEFCCETRGVIFVTRGVMIETPRVAMAGNPEMLKNSVE